MKCPYHNTTMTPLGSCVSKDERLIVTSYLCSCGYRTIGRTPNPRYVAQPSFESKPENKGARTKRNARVDEGYTPRPCCSRCGEVLRDAVFDGLCGLCADDAAQKASAAA